ncbi:MAG: flagellar export chaperone FliS, partial [Planctomycetia bacterium]|nr:flagellar export chaperone FliS [Planctomycetia bacterium]
STAAANPYLRTKILTASPQELRLMLYDGAIKFCRQAKDAIDRKNYEQSYHGLMRAQKIVLELSTSLNSDLDADLYSKLSALYTYIYRLLVDANMERTSTKVDEAIGLIEYEKETWQLLMKKQAVTAAGVDTGAQQTAISSLSTNA